MSNFPSNSAFGEPIPEDVRQLFEESDRQIAKEAKSRDVVSVSLSDLESWYATINAVVDHLPDYRLANSHSAKDELYDVRDAIYRLLP